MTPSCKISCCFHYIYSSEDYIEQNKSSWNCLLLNSWCVQMLITLFVLEIKPKKKRPLATENIWLAITPYFMKAIGVNHHMIHQWNRLWSQTRNLKHNRYLWRSNKLHMKPRHPTWMEGLWKVRWKPAQYQTKANFQNAQSTVLIFAPLSFSCMLEILFQIDLSSQFLKNINFWGKWEIRSWVWS